MGKGRGIFFKHSSNMRMFAFQSQLMELIVAAMRETERMSEEFVEIYRDTSIEARFVEIEGD